MATQTTTINRDEISHLCDRLDARATSRLMNGTPELQRDLHVAVVVLRRALAIGFPIRPNDLDETADTADTLRPAAAMLRQMTVLIIEESNLPIVPDMAAMIVRTVQTAAG